MRGATEYSVGEKKHNLPFGNVMARSEDIPWANIKLVWRKESAVLWAQINVQLQSPMWNVPLLEKIQQRFEHRMGKSNSKANL